MREFEEEYKDDEETEKFVKKSKQKTKMNTEKTYTSGKPKNRKWTPKLKFYTQRREC